MLVPWVLILQIQYVNRRATMTTELDCLSIASAFNVWIMHRILVPSPVCTHRYTYIYAYLQKTDRQTDRGTPNVGKTDRWMDGQTDGKTDRHNMPS
jgi:hypothetical protein